jgi:hypothetical protein
MTLSSEPVLRRKHNMSEDFRISVNWSLPLIYISCFIFNFADDPVKLRDLIVTDVCCMQKVVRFLMNTYKLTFE